MKKTQELQIYFLYSEKRERIEPPFVLARGMGRFVCKIIFSYF